MMLTVASEASGGQFDDSESGTETVYGSDVLDNGTPVDAVSNS